VYLNFCKEKTVRVLHVDDDAGFLAVAKQCLEEQSQFQVDTALSSKEALEKLKHSEYDAVVSDYKMPEKNGLELLRDLRQQGNDVPFILFACKGQEENAIEVLNSGVYRYVGKEGNAEVTYGELKRSICDAVRGQRAEKLFRDFTESKKIFEKNRFQSRLLSSVGQAIIATDMNGKIIYWNNAAEQLYGWQEAEVLGRSIVDVTPAESSQEQAAKIMKRLTAGEYWSGEFLAKRRDGTLFPAIVTNAPITNDKGELIGTIGVSTDISEQKWMQEIFNEAIAKVVELNEKLQVVESLTRHDIRNKLSALNGRIFLLKKRLSDNTEALSHVKEMELVFQQMLRILEFEKYYVQVGSEEPKDIDVEKYVSEAVLLFSDLKGAKLINECRGLTVLADSMLRQLFYNLIDNTLKYGKKVGRIRVHYKEEGNQLKLVYEDDGVGIPDDEKSNLFQEGYGKGTGFGLYLIKRICEAYGWTIQETGKQGKGAQFTMTIPKNVNDGKRLYEIS
jgi:PAS domain S-box-containing protein